MSLLQHLLSKNIVISRLTTVSGYKKAYTTTTAADVNLQPLSGSKSQLFEGATGKNYALYCDPNIDIQEGDKFRDIETGKLYKVKTGGVTPRSEGSMDYLKVIVEQVS